MQYTNGPPVSAPGNLATRQDDDRLTAPRERAGLEFDTDQRLSLLRRIHWRMEQAQPAAFPNEPIHIDRMSQAWSTVGKPLRAWADREDDHPFATMLTEGLLASTVAEYRPGMTDSQRPLTILIVDDCPDTCRSTADLLALYGYDVRYALRGDEALRMAEENPPDVVLLDIWMPGLSGYEVARRLAGRDGKPPLVVAVTGCATDADRGRTALAGFHLHLVKPVDPAVLTGMLKRFQTATGSPSPLVAAYNQHEVS